MSPVAFLASHFPLTESWQLKSPALSEVNFLSQPFHRYRTFCFYEIIGLRRLSRPAFFKFGLHINHTTTKLTVASDSLIVRFSGPNDLRYEIIDF